MSFSGLAPTTSEVTVNNDGFYPDISVADFITNYGVSGDIESDRLENEIIRSMFWVNAQLSEIKTQVWAEIAALDEVEQITINDKKLLVLLYQDAVFSHTKLEFLLPSKDLVTQSEASAMTETYAQDLTYWTKRRNDALGQLTSAGLAGGDLSGDATSSVDIELL
jgi:hypothetical protein